MTNQYLIKVLVSSLILVGLNACTTVSISTRSSADAILSQRMTILTSGKLSHDTQNRLLQAGITENTCLADISNCVVQLKNSSFIDDDKGLFATYSELFYSSALHRQKEKNCHTEVVNNSPKDKKISCFEAYQDDMLQAVRFAYVYLVYDSLKNNQQSSVNLLNNNISIKKNSVKNLRYLPHERDIRTQDILHVAIDELGNSLYEKQLKNTYQITNNHLYVTINGKPIPHTIHSANVVSSNQLNLVGLNSISRRDGIGVDYVTILDNRYTTSIRQQISHHSHNTPAKQRIHSLGHLPATVLLTPRGHTLEEVLKTSQFDLQIFDPYLYDSVEILGNHYALSANFSASYALWLNENALSPLSIFNMLSHSHQNSQPQLFMLEPYNPNKRVIIMLHGLASSPETWIQLTNDIFNDPALRKNYQVWQVFYPTNIPILENRFQINQLLETAFKQVDPNQQDKASEHAVIIGHSMGGVIGRLLLSNDNLTTKLNDMIAEYDNNHWQNSPSAYRKFSQKLADNEINQRFQLHALTQVDRAVFISAPFRGTDYADKWFTRALRRIISLPMGFVQMVNQNLAQLSTQGELVDNSLAGLFLENGASQLSDKSFFMQLTKDVNIASQVAVHTIIATDDQDLFKALKEQTQADELEKQKTLQPVKLYDANHIEQKLQQSTEKERLLNNLSQGVTNRISDGVVPYRSAHLEKVESEKILAGKHNVHTSPQAVLELRRILHKQLKQHGLPNATNP